MIKTLKEDRLAKDFELHLRQILEFESPYCSSVFHFEWIKGRPSLIMEYIDGVTLESLSKELVLKSSVVLEIKRQVALALLDLQRKGLVHGDLSLANIMIDRWGQVKLIDYAMSQNVVLEKQATVAFAAPEIMEGGAPSFDTDIYSLQRIVDYLLPEGSHRVSLAPAALSRPDFEAQNQLTESVVEVMRIQASRSFSTVTLPGVQRLSQTTWGSKNLALRLGLWALLSFFLGTMSSSYSMSPGEYATLSVRTAQWVQLEVAGQDLGYSPIRPQSLLPGTYQLHYKTYKGKGSRTLTLKKGEHRVLSDSFFQ